MGWTRGVSFSRWKEPGKREHLAQVQGHLQMGWTEGEESGSGVGGLVIILRWRAGGRCWGGLEVRCAPGTTQAVQAARAIKTIKAIRGARPARPPARTCRPRPPPPRPRPLRPWDCRPPPCSTRKGQAGRGAVRGRARGACVCPPAAPDKSAALVADAPTGGRLVAGWAGDIGSRTRAGGPP